MTYTNGQKKGYRIVYHIIAYFAVAEGWLLLDIGWFVLFYEIQEHCLFGICKSYTCCYWVWLPTLNQVKWSETSVGRFEGNAWFFYDKIEWYLTFPALCIENNWCNEKRMFQNIESSSHYNIKPHIWSTNAYKIHKKKWQSYRALSESIRYWPLLLTFCPLVFWVYSNHHPSSFYKVGCICDLMA